MEDVVNLQYTALQFLGEKTHKQQYYKNRVSWYGKGDSFNGLLLQDSLNL